MSIYELTILSMVLHTCSDAAPHSFARSRIDPVVTRTHAGEIYISSMLRMLCRKNMVEESTLVIIRI